MRKCIVLLVVTGMFLSTLALAQETKPQSKPETKKTEQSQQPQEILLIFLDGIAEQSSDPAYERTGLNAAAIKKGLEGLPVAAKKIDVKDPKQVGWVTLRIDQAPESSGRPAPPPGWGASHFPLLATAGIVIVHEDKNTGWWSHSEVLNLNPDDPTQASEQIKNLIIKSRKKGIKWLDSR